jgi:O-antigen/teichoic acid export membrane protein
MTDLSAADKPGDLAHLATGRARAALSGLAWSLLNVALTTVLAAAVFLVTSRLLAPEDFGAVAFAAAIVALIGTAVPTAFGEALIQRADLRPDHLDTVFWLALGVGAVGYAGILAVSPAMAAWAEVPVLAQILPVLGLRLLFDAGLTVPAALIARRMRFRLVTLRTAVANGLGAAVCLVLVLNGFALWALVISQVATAAAAWAVAAATAGWRPGFGITAAALRELGRFGLYAMGGRALTEARIDQLLLGAVLGPAALGLFYFARRLFVMLRDLTAGAFTPVTNALMASLQGEPEKRREAYLAASFAAASLAFPVFAGLIAVAPTAVPYVFGGQWTGAVFAVQCLSVVGILAGLGVLQAALIRNLGRPDWWFRYQAAMQLSTVPLVLTLFPFGLDAIMAAIAIRTLLLWPLSVRMAGRMLEMPATRYAASLAAPAAASAAMALAVAALPAMAPDLGPAALLAAQVAGGAALYAGLLALAGHRRLGEIARMVRARRAAA